MRYIAIIVCGFLLLASCTSTPGHNSSSKTRKTAGSKSSAKLPVYKIGYMICNSRKETNARFKPLTAYLSKKLGVNLEMEAIDTTDFSKRVDDLDFTHTNSLLYIIMHRYNGIRVLATEKKDSLGSMSQGIIITLKNSHIKRIEDLKGKTMIFGPTLAPTGFMSQIDILQRHGINPDKDLAFYTVPKGSDKHEKVAYAVLFHRYDAGALPLADVQRMAAENKISMNDFRILARGEIIPYCNFAVTQRVSAAFAKKFEEALVGINKKTTVAYDGEVLRVLKQAGDDGYEPATDAEFDVVRAMAKRTNMPPYQKY
ncbi:phosphate/phosphite/phosphonate ABC transporter substrate-binding protein [Desulfobacterota bacterium M19]